MKKFFTGLLKQAEDKAKEFVGEEKVNEIKAKATMAAIVGKGMLEQAGQTVEAEVKNLKETVSKEIENGGIEKAIGKIFGGNQDENAAPASDEAPFVTDVNKDGSFGPAKNDFNKEVPKKAAAEKPAAKKTAAKKTPPGTKPKKK